MTRPTRYGFSTRAARRHRPISSGASAHSCPSCPIRSLATPPTSFLTILVVLGWHLFWCRAVDAVYTKLVGVVLLLGCLASFLSLAFGTLESAGKAFRAGGYAGDWLAGQLAEYLNRTGSIIFILTISFLAIILSTQFSFGRVFAVVSRWLGRWSTRAVGVLRDWRDRRRRERQRQEVLRKHLGTVGASTARTEVLAQSPVPLPRAAQRHEARAT